MNSGLYIDTVCGSDLKWDLVDVGALFDDAENTQYNNQLVI